MIAPGEDKVQRVKSAVESWAAEIAEVRSSLSQKLSVEIDTSRPAFRLHRTKIAVPVPSTPAPQPLDPDLRRVESELEFAREQLIEINRAASAAAQLAAEKTDRAEEAARALGRTRLDLDEAREQIRAKDWTLIQLKNENDLLRGGDHAHFISRAVPAEDYDALATSHMDLREETAELQQRIIQRDHELIAARNDLAAAQAELSAWESTGPVTGAGIAKLAGVLAERSAALEEFEGTALGQKYLIGALRQELDALRETLGRREFDHDRLARALRTELECLRALSTEHGFVIGHQSASLETVAQREHRLEAELAQAQEAGKALRRQADQAAEECASLSRQLQLLREKLVERESEVWKLRSAPLPAPSADAPGLAQLEAALAARDAELDRARERIAFLRGVPGGAQAAIPVPSTVAETVAADSVSSEPITVESIQVNAAVQREVEHALTYGFSWPLIGIVGGIAGFGMLLLGLMALLLAR